MAIATVRAVSIADCDGDDSNDHFLLLNVAAPEFQRETMLALK
jgi:hypothetical protein